MQSAQNSWQTLWDTLQFSLGDGARCRDFEKELHSIELGIIVKADYILLYIWRHFRWSCVVMTMKLGGSRYKCHLERKLCFLCAQLRLGSQASIEATYWVSWSSLDVWAAKQVSRLRTEFLGQVLTFGQPSKYRGYVLSFLVKSWRDEKTALNSPFCAAAYKQTRNWADRPVERIAGRSYLSPRPFCKSQRSDALRIRGRAGFWYILNSPSVLSRVPRVDARDETALVVADCLSDWAEDRSPRTAGQRWAGEGNLRLLKTTWWMHHCLTGDKYTFCCCKIHAFIFVYRRFIARRHVHLRHGAFICENKLSITIFA